MACWLNTAGRTRYERRSMLCSHIGFQAVVLMLVLPDAHTASLLRAHSLADAKQNSTVHLRAHSLGVGKASLLVQLGHKRDSCQCTFNDQCTCEGALKFMDCVKTACNSGDCQCLEGDGTNHFLESCSAMADECPGTGLKCMPAQATCDDHGVAWHSKVKHHAVTDEWEAIEKDTSRTAPAKAEAEMLPRKYVLHTKYKATVLALQSNGHRVFAQGVVITLVVLSMTIAFATSTKEQTANNTWSVIDFVVVTFLGFSWFVVVMHGLDYFLLTGIRKVLVHLALVVLLLLVSLLVSWRLRSSDVNVDIFNSIFPPLVMWCNAGLLETIQNQIHSDAWASSTFYMFWVLIVLPVGYTAFSLIIHYVLSRFLTTRGWGRETEDLAIGGALACGFVMWCHLCISGSYHTLEGPYTASPSFTTVMMLNFLSLCFLVVATAITPIISKKSQTLVNSSVGSNGYWKLRLSSIVSWFLKFLPCFSFMLSISHFIFGQMGYLQGSVGARLLFLLASIVIAMLMIVLCTYVPFLKRDTDVASQLRSLLVCLGGFLVGVAWSGLLDNSINMMARGKGYHDAFIVELAITSFLTLFIFPVYFCFLKPVIMRKSE